MGYGVERVSYITDNPYAVIDAEEGLGRVVVRYSKRVWAEWYLEYLRGSGGAVTRAKVDRGGYRVEGPPE